MRRFNTDRLKLEISRSRNAFITYVLLVALGVFAFGYIFSKEVFVRPFTNYYKLRLVVADAKGISAGKQQVRVDGVPIGLISGVALDHGQAVITVSIDHKYSPFFHDATAQLRAATPLDDMYVQMTRGTPSTGALANNAIIPETQTITPVDISRVLQVFDLDTRQRLSIMFSEFGAGLQDNGLQLKQTFAQLAPFLQATDRVTRALADRKTEMQQVIHNFATLSGAVADTDSQLSGLITHGDQTLAQLASSSQPLSSTIQQLPPTLSALKSSLATVQQAEGQLDPALVALEPVATQLPSGLAALRSFSAAAQPAFRAARPAIASLQPLASSLRPTSASLQSAFATLQPQAAGFNTISAQAANCPFTIRKFFAWSDSVLAYADAGGVIPRGDVSFGLDSAGTNTDLGMKYSPSCAVVPGGE
jgi:phospholipid/cholesterol/gamma-HCH transport system substrate-binding protein